MPQFKFITYSDRFKLSFKEVEKATYEELTNELQLIKKAILFCLKAMVLNEKNPFYYNHFCGWQYALQTAKEVLQTEINKRADYIPTVKLLLDLPMAQNNIMIKL